MNIDEAKKMLTSENITFSEVEYKDACEFTKHIYPFDKADKNADFSIKTLVIKSNNGYKNIELVFTDEGCRGSYTFADLCFGEWFYNMSERQEEALRKAVIDEINAIISNEVAVITTTKASNGKWLSTRCFDKRDNGDAGLLGYNRMIEKLEKEKSFIAKLFSSKMQYEIYDRNTYRRIEK